MYNFKIKKKPLATKSSNFPNSQSAAITQCQVIHSTNTLVLTLYLFDRIYLIAIQNLHFKRERPPVGNSEPKDFYANTIQYADGMSITRPYRLF